MTAPALPAGTTRGRSVPDSPVVSVCVLVLADVGRIGDCLDSIHTATVLPVETMVVANGTPSNLLAGLAARDDIVLVRSPANLGFAGGSNLAARCSRGKKYLVFVNDDSVLAPEAIDHLVARAESDPAIGAVGCRILSTDGSLQEAGSVLWRDGTSVQVGKGEPGAAGRYLESRDVDFCSANGFLVERPAWDAVGGFDPGYHPAYYEDVDLCLALREHGYRVVYEPSARLTHAESSSTTPPYKVVPLGVQPQASGAAMGDGPVGARAATPGRTGHRHRAVGGPSPSGVQGGPFWDAD